MSEDSIMIITGTRKGIGKYLAEYYLEHGMTVIGCSRSESDLEHERYSHYCLDVSDEKSIKKMVFTIYKKYKHIDYLINNAGVASMNHSFLTPLSTVENIFKTNVFGTFLFCREVGKIMMKRKFGRIVNFTTVAVPLKLAGETAYTASKAAVESLTETFSREYAEYGITINAVAPTLIKTDLIKNVPKAKLDNLLKRQAIHRFGKIEEICNVIDFFIKSESELVTGQIIYLGGA